MIGTTLAHYRITAALGAGGMGEVWRATDTKLGREVALKVLPEEFVDDPQRLDRFEREARAVASLNHPHIVTIHSVEEADGIRFLTMELIEGRSLDKLILEDGMELGLFFDLAVPLAEAISAAHDKSVIHRDLKPPNVMVDADGRLKVLDFGLAKVREVGDASDSTELPTEALTGIGMVVGTMPYMSPEQIEGEIVDHRTDIFSLGVLLYEMAVGERPFLGKSSPALMSSILKDVPTPVVELRSDLPRHLGRIIGRCLEKKRRDRYQTARDVFNELKALQTEASSMVAQGHRPAAGPSRAAPRPPSHSGVSSSGLKADEGFWVAVLPFKYTGGDEDLVALAEGLSEDIVTGLSRFSYLRVIARGSTLKYASEGIDVRAVGEELGARYVMEGSLRRAGKKLRLAVQLVDTQSGVHLWAEAYDRNFDADDLFAVQDELVPTIVSTVADTHGVLPRSMGEALRSCPPEELSPYEAVLRSFSYFERVTAEELAAAREGLLLAVQKAPDSADAWAMLALLGAQEYGQGFKLLADPLESSANAARRAVEAGPSNHLAHFSLAQVLFFQKEFEAFRNAAARAAELNPMDGNSIAFLGELLIYSGDSERGLELAGRAKRLNPTHPGWYWYADFFYAYREHDYSAALAITQKVNLPDHWGQHAAIAVACGQLGDREAAGKAIERLLDIRPDFADIARQECEKWWDAELVEQMLDGFSKAGFEIPATSASVSRSKTAELSRAPDSGAARADEGFWVAVLPFKYNGDDADLASLAEGLTEEIVTGLSRFSFLRVIARSSTSHIARDTDDVRAVGKELGARYVMEGSIRRAGSMLRIATQLVDAMTGAHLWAETYNRSFHPGAIFELQDDLVPRIVSTVADWSGVLPRALSEAVRSKTADELSPYEAVLRGCGYYQRVRPDEHAAVRAGLERAVAEAPRYADAWVMLSMMCGEEHRFGFNVKPDSLGRALHAARQAVDADPSNHLAHLALAQAMFFRKEFVAFRSAAERALAVNPMDGFTVEYLGHLLAFAGDWERGCELGEKGRQLNPHHPAWYWALPFLDAFRKGDYEGARTLVPKAVMPGQYYSQALFAALYGQLGEGEAAGEALREVLALKPDFAEIASDQFGKWYLPQLVELLLDGLQKAGLVIPADPDSGSSSTATHAPSSASVEAHAEEGFWVAVLPFKSAGDDADLTALAEGLSEGIVTGLSRFSYLRVIARGSATTGARYLMEGNLRRAGKKVRVAVQLVDTLSGAHLWAEAYDREFDSVGLFELQDDLVPRIVSTCADHFGVLARAISEVVRNKPIAEMTPYEALMRGFGYHFRLDPERARPGARRSGACSRTGTFQRRLLGHAVMGLLARVRPRIQPQARFPRPRARGRQKSRRPRSVQSPRSAGAGGCPILPQGNRGLSQCL